ncbi:rano class II histocompatibility A beta chain-like protein [Labeo rohita]|uniref:Rano class II histocompatibility A beta chain-like protein n=1 Tax=Labeo rohita TaxID=84645 RepID=A0A498MEC8_LABRO|nr:rano class II histocompatibility A beta chain-like protein [Labeo rohita]
MQYNLMAVVLSALFETVHGHYGYVEVQCRVPDSKQHIEFIFSATYNMIEYLRYNSSESKIVGYTEFGKKLAEDYNKNNILLAQSEFVLNECKRFGEFIVPISGTTVPPDVVIQLDNVNHKPILVCSAYDFYPKHIRLTWIRDDKVIPADVTSTEEQNNGDWFYQVHSYLEYFPKPGEKISCVVEHASSNKPMIYHWDPSLPESERSKIILGAVGLSMGVFMAAGGLIYYKRKQTVSQGIRKGNEKAVPVCSAYDFYHKPIKLMWMRDDKEVTADVMSWLS